MERLDDYGFGQSEHHIGMLADPKDIKPFRKAILKLDPAFADHPVWNDLA